MATRDARRSSRSLARALADHPDEVQVTETEHRGTTLVELTWRRGDLGKVIGRQGRTAAALRTLAPPTAPSIDGVKATLDIR